LPLGGGTLVPIFIKIGKTQNFGIYWPFKGPRDLQSNSNRYTLTSSCTEGMDEVTKQISV